jgi:hypothetical protein
LRELLLLLQREMRHHHLYNAFLTAVEVARRDPSMQEMRLQFHRATGESRTVDVNGQPLHRGAVNVPTSAPGVVSAVFSRLGPNTQPCDADCDFITFNRAAAVTHLVKFHNALFDSMAYPIIFFTRRTGWHPDLRSADERTRVTLREFTRFLLFLRDDDPVSADVSQLDYITKLGPLWQQYLCELYIRWEVSVLTYLRLNVQSRLRAAPLSALQANPNAPAGGMGVPVRLPASFQYSRAHREQCLNDGYAYMSRFGNASYFITMTANPNWPEVVDALRRGETVVDRPEVLVRVFLIKARMLLKMVRRGYFGTCLAYFRVIEFQLRGLPHMHLLEWVDESDRPRQPEDVDRVVCGEIPNAATHPRLRELVLKHMIHTPCFGMGTPPVRNGDKVVCEKPSKPGECSKRFPKPFSAATTIVSTKRGDNVRLRRCPPSSTGGQSCNMTVRGVITEVDARWVVPYNPILLLMFNCHINVELITSSVDALKYVLEYMSKSLAEGDVADVWLSPQDRLDEFKMRQHLRVVQSTTAVVHALDEPLVETWPPVTRLPVHLRDQRSVVFIAGDAHPDDDDEGGGEDDDGNRGEGGGGPTAGAVASQAANKPTKLEAYFDAVHMGLVGFGNRSARDLTYVEFPHHFWWDKRIYAWKPRRTVSDCVVALAAVAPADVELYSLRVLLQHVRGAASFDELMHPAASFRLKAQALNLVDNPQVFSEALRELAQRQRGPQFRRTFVMMLTYNQRADGPGLFHEFRHVLAEDFVRERVRRRGTVFAGTEEPTLRELRSAVLEMDAILADVMSRNDATMQRFNIPSPGSELFRLVRRRGSGGDGNDNDSGGNGNENADPNDTEPAQAQPPRHFLRVSYDARRERRKFEEGSALLNADQSLIVDAFQNAVSHIDDPRTVRLFVVEAAAGTGKSTLMRVLLHWTRAQGVVDRVCAPSALAATSYEDGRTLHATFNVPLNITERSVCNVARDTAMGDALRRVRVLFLDEAFMVSSRIVDIVSDLFNDLHRAPPRSLFANRVVVVFAGDPRQLLPVVKLPNRPIDEFLYNSYVFEDHERFTKFSLTRNMRAEMFAQRLQARGDEASVAEANRTALFSDWVLAVGEACAPACVRPERGANSLLLPQEIVFRREQRRANDTAAVERERRSRDLSRFITHTFGDLRTHAMPHLRGGAPDVAVAAHAALLHEHRNRAVDVFSSRIIYAPLVEQAQELNNMVVGEFTRPGAVEVWSALRPELSNWLEPPCVFELLSQDMAEVENGPPPNAPVDFLNGINGKGLPPHRLLLAVNMPVLIMRNLDPGQGLLNGVMCVVDSVGTHVVHVRIINRESAFYGQVAAVPRIEVVADPHSLRLPFNLRRFQFPLLPAFAVTINKGQGSTRERCGVFLDRHPCFSPGQLYSAITRVGGFSGLSLFLDDTRGQGYSGDDEAFFTQNPVLHYNLGLSDRQRREFLRGRYPPTAVEGRARFWQPQGVGDPRRPQTTTQPPPPPPYQVAHAPVAQPVWSSWFGADLTVWPPRGIGAGGQGSAATLSWIYCALMSEAVGGPAFPYTRLPAFLTTHVRNEQTGMEFDLATEWPRWVAVFTTACADDARVAAQPLPPQLHWSGPLQDDIVHRVDVADPLFTWQLSELLHHIGVFVDGNLALSRS